MVLPQSYCSLQRGFYLQPIILEFSFRQGAPLETSKPAFVYVRWKKGEKKKVRYPDGSLREYPILAFYICVNRDLAHKGTFRQAHHAIGAVVALAEKKGVTIDKLTRHDLAEVDDRLGWVNEKLGKKLRQVRGVSSVFNLQRAMALRNLIDVPQTKSTPKRWARPRKTF